MKSIELANVTGNRWQDPSFHRIEYRSNAHHKYWLKAFFSIIQPLPHTGPQPAGVFRGGQNGCNLLLYLTLHMILKTSGGAIDRLPPVVSDNGSFCNGTANRARSMHFYPIAASCLLMLT